MHGISGRQSSIAKHNLLGTLDNSPVNRENFIDNVKNCIEGRLDILMPVHCAVSVEDFLEDFCVRNQTLTLAYQPFQQPLRIGLVQVGRARQIHGDIGVHKNHGCGPLRYPRSISANMVSISAVGASCRAAVRIAASFFSTSPSDS